MLAADRLPRAGLLTAGLALALALRLVVAGSEGNTSVTAGLLFASVLLILVVSAGWRPGSLRLSPFAIGVFGALILIAIPASLRISSLAPVGQFPLGSFPPWALVVSAVAIAEEVLLRGILFSMVEKASGAFAAAAVGAIIFAFMHVPLYGWPAFPLDLAAGLWLGGLRVASRSVVAPAMAHALADLATWWLW